MVCFTRFLGRAASAGRAISGTSTLVKETGSVASWVDKEVDELWAGFPIDATPRPIVLLEERVRVEGGFIDVESKIAWMEGSIALDAPIPPAVVGLLPVRRPSRGRTQLTITGVTSTVAPFWCDRGQRELPAYRVQMTGLQGACTILAPDVDCWWATDEADQRRGPGSPATVDDDSFTIHFPAFGGVLTEFHRAEYQEHASYVVGRAITSERRVPSGTAVVAVGVIRTVSGRLSAPLGGRVLLHTSGQPLAVTSHAGAVE
jgi:hypothetical protein